MRLIKLCNVVTRLQHYSIIGPLCHLSRSADDSQVVTESLYGQENAFQLTYPIIKNQ